MSDDSWSGVGEHEPSDQRREWCAAGRRVRRVFWPVLLELASPGGMCVWVDVAPLSDALAWLRLDETFDMDVAHLLTAVMSPVTFGHFQGPVGPRLAAAARLAGTTPPLLLLCLLATAAHSQPSTRP
jgi:hypothetical protein